VTISSVSRNVQGVWIVLEEVVACPRHTDTLPEDDEALVRRVVQGELEAFRELVDRYQDPVFRVVRSLSRSPAEWEDLAQDVFVAAYRALPDFDAARGLFKSWLFAIARNRCMNQTRRPAPLLVEVLPSQMEERTPCDFLLEREFVERLDQALDGLPDAQRVAFVMRELVGLSSEEVAEIEAVDVGTVRSRLSRAKAQLRAALRPPGGDER
jgi:RNA polymerase sigma-70 factor (ECF subfamily)